MKSRSLTPIIVGVLFTDLILRAQAQTAQSPILFRDLEGKTIVATLNYAMTARRLDDGKIRNNTSRQKVTLRITNDQSIAQTHEVTAVGGDGNVIGTSSLNASFVLNKPRKGAYGDIVWRFEEGKLVRLQAFESGGRRIAISFRRSENGLDCTVEAPYAREQNSGPVRTRSSVGGQSIELLDAKLVESTCNVHPLGGRP